MGDMENMVPCLEQHSQVSNVILEILKPVYELILIMTMMWCDVMWHELKHFDNTIYSTWYLSAVPGHSNYAIEEQFTDA